MQINTTGKILNTAAISSIIIEGEINATAIQIYLPLELSGNRLDSLSYSLAGYTNKDTRIDQVLVKRVTQNAVVLDWVPRPEWAAISCLMQLELIGADSKGTVLIKWQSTAPITVKQTLGTGPMPTPDVMQQYLSMAQSLTLQAAAAAERAENAAAKSESVLADAKLYTDRQLDLALTERIYSVLYFDPTDGNKRPLQEVLDRMQSQRIGAYTCAELENKGLTCKEFTELGLTCKDITRGGW